MERWLVMIGLLVLVLALAGCGGDNGGDTDNGNGDGYGDATGDPGAAGDASGDGGVSTPQPTLIPAITATFPPPAPRSRELPGGDPVAFEVPFSAGGFVRASLTGNPVSAQSGGQRAIYTGDDATVVLSVYYFAQTDEATRTVEFTLNGSGVAQVLAEPYYAPTVSYGIVQHTNGSHVAAWSHQGWVFIVQTEAFDVLQTFLDVFPY